MRRLWLRFKYWRLLRMWARIDISDRRALEFLGASPDDWAVRHGLKGGSNEED